MVGPADTVVKPSLTCMYKYLFLFSHFYTQLMSVSSLSLEGHIQSLLTHFFLELNSICSHLVTII